MTAWASMKHDLLPLGPMTLREKVSMWALYYWRPTKRWLPKVEQWWDYKVLRYPPPPPLAKDRIARHHGFVDDVPPCTDGPVCAEHGWELSPLVTGTAATGPDNTGRFRAPETGVLGPEGDT